MKVVIRNLVENTETDLNTDRVEFVAEDGTIYTVSTLEGDEEGVRIYKAHSKKFGDQMSIYAKSCNVIEVI